MMTMTDTIVEGEIGTEIEIGIEVETGTGTEDEAGMTGTTEEEADDRLGDEGMTTTTDCQLPTRELNPFLILFFPDSRKRQLY